MHSAIYRGILRHRRFTPNAHKFSYPVFMMYLDLDELDEFLAVSPWWSAKPWRPARFERNDFLGDPKVPLKQAVQAAIFEHTGHRHQGPIRMLVNLRYFGFNINPISCYYCFDSQEALRFIVVEVINTPWKERQSYVLTCDPIQRFQKTEFKKLMHVSPFNPMQMNYLWCSNQPQRVLSLNLETQCDGEIHTDATLVLKRHEISSASLAGILLRYPGMTAKVVVKIYWQALWLWLKSNPIYDHPRHELKKQQRQNTEQSKISTVKVKT